MAVAEVRAVVCNELTGEDGLAVRDDWPEPGPLQPGQVRIAVRAASVNFPDTLVTRGRYQLRLEPPFVVGNEAAGEVLEVGADVTGVVQGQRVLTLCGSGAFAEQVAVTLPFQHVHVVPDTMPWHHAAAFDLTFGTAGHGLLQRGRLAAGETLLVNGAAGGCGSAALQVAKASGATVIAVAGGATKCDLARALGADHVLDHHELSGDRALSTAVQDLTGGHGVDVVFDNVGTGTRDLLRCLAWNGRFLVVGFAGGEVPAIGLNLTILKSVSVIGVAYGASAIQDPESNRALFSRLFAWYETGRLAPHVGARFPLERAAEAVGLVHRRAAVGKVVLDVG